MSLTKQMRDALPDSSFAVPAKRALPINDAAHVKMAWDSVSKTNGLTEQERTQAREHILSKAKELGIDTGNWHTITASFSLDAMSLEAPTDEHPNKMPFSGILTRIDLPSDNPVGGAQGHRTLLPHAVAETALSSLLGMAIDYTPNLDGHDKKSKLGIITEATIEGDSLHIKGFLYAADFPEECARIQAEKEKLGFSYECQARIQSLAADPWVIEHCTFTGAAVLYKDKAAYTTTSLAAKAELELEMTKEELQAILDATIKPLAASIEKQGAELAEIKKTSLEAGKAHDVVKPHAEALRNCAASMEAAGIGGDAKRGHVRLLNDMASQMEADGVMGRIPHIYRDHDFLYAAAEKTAQQDPETKKTVEALQASIDGLGTQLKDLSAKAFTESAAPQRKTISPEIKSLLAKHGMTEEAEKGSLSIETVDKTLTAAGLSNSQRIAAKVSLLQSGLLPATKAAA